MTQARHLPTVLYVGTLPPHPGGSALSGAGLLAGLSARGHAIRALAPIVAEPPRSGDAFAAAHPGIPVTRFLVPRFVTAPNIPPDDEDRDAQRSQLQRLLPALVSRERPDVIFIGRESFVGDVLEALWRHAPPTVLRLAGGTTGGLLRGTYSGRHARELVDGYRSVTIVVSPAKHLAERVKALGLANVTVVPNAIDLNRFAPRPKDGALLRELAIRPDDLVIAHLSNLKALKRPLDLVRSAREALRRRPGLVYLVVGDGALRHVMEEECRRAGLSDSFRFVGWVDYGGIPDYVNLADIVVMPSEDEGLARVYLETQACGRVLVASDIPAAREVVLDGETGLLFKSGDVQDLTDKILRAAGDANLRARIGREARHRVKGHSLDDAVARYADVLIEAWHRTP